MEKELTVFTETARLAAYAPVPAIPLWEPESEPHLVPFAHYLWVIKRHRWKILAFVAASTLATFIVSQRITPIYESTATIDIDRQTPPGVIGQEANRSVLNDSDQFLATQIKLVQSDSVLRPVAHKYRLLEHEGRIPQPRAAAEQAPVTLRKLKVTRPINTYLILVSYRSPNAQLAADVANAVARSYLDHTYDIRFRSSASLSQFMEKQLEELRAKMERSSAALAQFERELNVINPEEKTNILSARLLQLNTEYTHAQADRVRKEAAYQSVRSGSFEAAQVSTQGEPLRKITEHLNEAQEKFSEVKAHYGVNHPEYRRAAAQLAEVQRQYETTSRKIGQRVEIEYHEALSREHMLRRAVAETKTEFDRLNARSFEYQSFKREAEADKKLYEELVRKIKEAGINAGFQNSSIRIADLARPAIRAMFPNLRLNLVLAFLLSSVVALGAALLNDALDNTVRDPEQAARTLKTQVLGSLPSVKSWRGMLPAAVEASTGALATTGHASDPAVSGYGEAIRTLRNSILLSDFDRRLRSILVTSASPGEGKSTVACQLASTHAAQGHRTLLIDGDLRRPSVHKQFNLSAAQGLSSVLTGEMDWRQAVVTVQTLPGLEVLTAGPPSRRAADLIGRSLGEVLEEAGREYDLVVLDAPPLLGFAEPLQMASVADGVIVVTRAGETSRKAVASVIHTLARLRANVVGIVLNRVHQEMSDSYYYYGHYASYYPARGRA